MVILGVTLTRVICKNQRLVQHEDDEIITGVAVLFCGSISNHITQNIGKEKHQDSHSAQPKY